MTTLRPLGIGSQILTHGDRMAGFYGEVSNIITADELRSMVGVAQGTPMQTGDITWLKFSHIYKTLYIAKQPIQHSISWDYLQERDLVFGKMVEIGGNVYLLRLMQGSNINPVGYSMVVGVNNEWMNLIQKSKKGQEWNIYTEEELGTNLVSPNFTGSNTWCQEVANNDLSIRTRLFNHQLGTYYSSSVEPKNAWRPVLELLY